MNQRGQFTLEIVLLVPLLLLLMFLIFELGHVFFSWLIVTNAAREGTRYGVTQTFDSTDQCGGASGNSGCTTTDYNIQTRVAQTAQYLSIPNAGNTNNKATCGTTNQPPAGSPACITVIRGIDSSSRDTLTVLLVYQVPTGMPINGRIPFLGSFNYPGTFTVLGLSTMRSE